MTTNFEIIENMVTKYIGDDSNFVIPNSYVINGVNTKITIIKDSMFKCCRLVEDVIVSEGIKTIEKEVFSNCSNLKSILLPKTIISIGERAFYGCSNLSKINIPSSVTIIEERTFSYCHKLKTIDFPVTSQLTTICSGVFRCCDSLTEMKLPKKMKIIEEYAFSCCEKLTKIMIPSSVVKIADNTFLDSPNVVIYTTKESYAEDYAKKNKLKCVIIN